jgi:hypothetical protein
MGSNLGRDSGYCDSKFLAVFLSPRGQRRQLPRLVNDHFLPNTFQFIIHEPSYHCRYWLHHKTNHRNTPTTLAAKQWNQSPAPGVCFTCGTRSEHNNRASSVSISCGLRKLEKFKLCACANTSFDDTERRNHFDYNYVISVFPFPSPQRLFCFLMAKHSLKRVWKLLNTAELPWKQKCGGGRGGSLCIN